MTILKRTTTTFLLLLILILSCSATAWGANTKAKAPVSTWTIPEYGEKAYNTVMSAMAAYDPLAETAPGLDCTAAMLIEADTGTCLYEMDPDGLRYPASMTKLMTLVITLEAIHNGTANYDDVLTFSAEAVAVDGTKTGYKAGDTDTLQHCLEMLMVFSANDDAYVIAEHIAGSITAFADLMNAKAAELGMTGTHYVNPNGLHDPNHYSTARDMITLARFCICNEEIMKYASLKSTTMPNGKVIYNSNKLLWWTEGTDGLKTGQTTVAGRCLTATAERNGMRLIAVVMGSIPEYTHYINAMKLLEYGFCRYSKGTAVTEGQDFGEIASPYTKEGKVKVVAAGDVPYVFANNGTPQVDISTETVTPDGPQKAGSDCGDVIVTVNGSEVGRCDLISTAETHKRTLWQWLRDFFKSFTGNL